MRSTASLRSFPRTARLARRRLATALGLVLAGASGAAFPAPGQLDPAFGQGGVVFLEGLTGDPTFLGHDYASALAPLPDGRVLVAGSFDMGRDLGYSNMALVRLLADGDPDPAFGDDANGGTDGPGRTEVQLAGDQDEARALLVQPDGRIVLAGALEPSANSDFAVARFLADGTLDTSFGEANGGARLGYARVNVGPSSASNDYAVAVARQAQGANAGKLVLAGSGLAAEGAICCYRRFGLARFHADGSLDLNFGGNGTGFFTAAHSGNASGAEYPTAIATLPDGTLPDDRITVVGLTNSPTNPTTGLVRRFLPDGTPDTSFDGDGLLVIPNTFASGVYSGLKSVDAAMYQPDGKLVLVGRAGDHGFTFLRLHADGSRDTSFGSNGRVSVRFPGSVLDDEPAALAIQGNGKIVAAGFFASDDGADFAVVRLLKNGSLDSRFGIGGRVTHPLVADTDTAAAVAILADGDILAAGLAQRQGISNLQTDMAFLRLEGDPDIFGDGFESD